MGKVIKGSADSGQRYTLAIPSAVAPGNDYAAAFDLQAGAATPAELSEFDAGEPLEPAFDLDEIAASAQQLIDDAGREAQGVLDAAQQRVDALLADAQARAAVITDDARSVGHDEGYAAGVREAEAAFAERLDTLRELVESGLAERHDLFTSAEPELVKLAVGIAERVLHAQIALDPNVVVEMAKAAITRLVEREKITVRVNPADVDRMREHREQLLALGDVRSMRVIEDQRVDRGGVLLETDGGSIDAKISTQLAEARKLLHIVDDVVVEPLPDRPRAPQADATALLTERAS